MGKTPPLLLGRRVVVCSIWSQALEFGWVTHPSAGPLVPLLLGKGKVVWNIWSHALECGWVRLPLHYGQERSDLKHLESCTEVWVGKTPPLLMVRREVVSNIWSHALKFG